MTTRRIDELHAEVDAHTSRLQVLHADRLACKRGCSGCCQDDLTVFEIEAQPIRERHATLLASGTPHAAGACAFLDDAGACRIYDARPYVCRTQGLPLRWIDEDENGPVELRDICPLNDDAALEAIPEDDCWTLGPTEERLARLQLETAPEAPRVSLRSLFSR